MGKTYRSMPKMCGNCGRVSEEDLTRGFCPVSAQHIRRNKPAKSCCFYCDSDDGFTRSSNACRKSARNM